MILVADSGSTKTEWALAEDPERIDFLVTAGYNPYFDKKVTWEIPLSEWLQKRSVPGKDIDRIYYYGAGCDRQEGQEAVRKALLRLLPGREITVEDDLTGAARALYGSEEGVALILGTGTNAGVWDGMKILQKSIPVGYLLGDHGSGASLGLRFVRAWLDGELPQKVASAFYKRYALTRQSLKEKVYLVDKPNFYLATFSPFIREYIQEEAVADIVRDEFRRLVRIDLLPLAEGADMRRMRATGSVAWFFRELLEQIMDEYGLVLEKTVRYPLKELVQLHSHLPPKRRK
jgi:N-acetylglucosamine kinase-like BadF-type ATPase